MLYILKYSIWKIGNNTVIELVLNMDRLKLRFLSVAKLHYSAISLIWRFFVSHTCVRLYIRVCDKHVYDIEI